MASFARFKGLYLGHNPSTAPEGSMGVAQNVVIRDADAVEPRRGQYTLPYSWSEAAARASSLFPFGTHLLAHLSTGTITRLDEDAGSFSNYDGTFTSPRGRLRAAESAEGLYVPTSEGLKFLDDAVTGEFSDAGVPRALDITHGGGTASAAGFLPVNYAAAYRVTFGQEDSTGKVNLGAPSGRLVVANTDAVIPIAGLVRTGGSTVTVTVPEDYYPLLQYLVVGQTVTMVSAGEANFAAGAKTVATVSLTTLTFTYSEAGVNAASTAAQTFSTGARSNRIDAAIPSGIVAGDRFQVWRTEIETPASVDPGDECFQVADGFVPQTIVVPAANVEATAGTWTITYTAHGYKIGQKLYFPERTAEITITAITTDTFQFILGSETLAPGLLIGNFRPLAVFVVDNTPDSFLGDPLYTNSNTGEGPLAAHYEPPNASDIAQYDGKLWLSRLEILESLEIQLLGTSGNCTIYAYGLTFTQSSINNFLTGAFKKWTGSSSAALNVERTARSLVECINRRTALSETFPYYAFYISGLDDPPGRILLQRKSFNTPLQDPSPPIINGVAVTDPTMWSPALPEFVAGVVPQLFENNDNPAGLAYSDTGNPQSWPLLNIITVGSKLNPISRIIALRETLFVFKEQGGVFVVPQSTPYRAIELDATLKLVAADSAVTMDNRIWALTAEGLVAITESGVELIGWPVVDEMRKVVNWSNIGNTAFAVAYDSEHTLEFWLPSTEADTCATRSLWYNTETQSWVEQPLERTCGLVSPATGVVHYGTEDSATLVRERKSFDWTDYADESVSVTISAANHPNVTIDTLGIDVGDTIVQGDSEAHVLEVNDYVLTVDGPDVEFEAGTATVFKAFESEAVLLPQALSDAGTTKHITQLAYSFLNSEFTRATSVWATDEAPTEHTEEMRADDGGRFGELGLAFPWSWGQVSPYAIRAAVDAMGAYIAAGLRVKQARTAWKLLSINPLISAQGSRTTKD